LWEGRIQLYGYNPFTTAPDASLLESLRDKNWLPVNHKEIPTIYWPVAQLLFRCIAWIYPSVYAFKLCFTLFDIGILVILLLLVKDFKIAPRHVILYALNPLPVIFTSGEGHVEVVAVFFLVFIIFLYTHSRFRLMYLFFGCAIMVKIFPLILLPLFVKRNNIKQLFFICIPLLSLFLFMDNSPGDFLAVPVHFATNFHYNGLFFTLFSYMFSMEASLQLSISIFLICYGIIFFITPHPVKAAALVSGVFLLCIPTFHPWYLLLISPFLFFFRSAAWLTLHLTILPLIFFFNPEAHHPFWHNGDLLFAIEFVPMSLVALWCMAGNKNHWPKTFVEPRSLSVIIPVRNEEKNIAGCISSITRQNYPCEIIVADGGSQDGTCSIVKNIPSVTVVSSHPGRGVQIREGLKHATGDILFIVHADSRLKENSLQQIMESLQRDPEASGGSFYTRYDNHETRFRFTELLNNLRIHFTGISFGDQGQFFRREAVSDFPAYKLMEDIELSFLLKESGKTLILRSGLTNSTRRWKKSGYVKTFFTVFILSITYIFMRKFNLISSDNREFFRLYYGG
jgi:rSAM/selenodomain-associated transferase 2